MKRGGWYGESALEVLAIAEVDQMPNGLVAAVVAAAGGTDAILRDLARSVCDRAGLQRPSLPHRELSPTYRIALPQLSQRRVPEFDREGTPFVDVNHPRQVIAPFDMFLAELAEISGLPPESVVQRAAQIARAPRGNAWTDAGHREMAERLKRRGPRHTYRPWAYLVGRRAAAQVLADLVDAFPDGVPSAPAVWAGLIASSLLMVEPGPLVQGTPLPWRSNGETWYDTRSWCDEVGQAADYYKRVINSDPVFVLAESSEWQSLEWARPQERRLVSTRHGVHRGPLPVVSGNAVEYVEGATGYQSIRAKWSEKELVVRGTEFFSNAPFLHWWALHPTLAATLGWIPDRTHLFGWVGTDGQWRARTEYLARGLMSHSPPSRAYTGEVWRVILSPLAHQELVEYFGPMSRSLTVIRTLPENHRNGRAEEQRKARVDLSGGLGNGPSSG
jgi:hypothetical protein